MSEKYISSDWSDDSEEILTQVMIEATDDSLTPTDQHVDSLRDQLFTQKIRRNRNDDEYPRKRNRHMHGIWAILATFVVGVAISLVIGSHGEQVLWADIQTTMREQTWVLIKNPDEPNSEVWYSPRNQIFAMVIEFDSQQLPEGQREQPRFARWIDFKKKSRLEIGVGTKIIRQLPPLPDHDATSQQLNGILGFLKPEGDQKVVPGLGLSIDSEPIKKEVNTGGKKIIRYLSILNQDSPLAGARVTTDVDPDTKLPIKVILEFEAKKLRKEIHYSYPKTGPSTIHELGFPKTWETVEEQ